LETLLSQRWSVWNHESVQVWLKLVRSVRWMNCSRPSRSSKCIFEHKKWLCLG
jgi:hypothetical protein